MPVSCPICGQPGEALCSECAGKIIKNNKYNKYKYKNEYFNGEDFDVYAASLYESDIKQAILALKYNSLRAAGKILGANIAEVFEKPNIDLLVPVPLHIGSKRNYNQAFEIALGLSSKWRVKTADICRWSRIISNRAGLNKDERESLTPDVFKIISPKKIKNLKIALVDDVCTTGSTLKCLAAAIEKAGAHVKTAYVIAHA